MQEVNESLEESPSSGLSFHLVSPPHSAEDAADIAVVGGREGLSRRSRRFTPREHEERAQNARRVLFEDRMRAVENRERNPAPPVGEAESEGEKRGYSYVSDNIRDKLDCGYTYREISGRYNIVESTVGI